MSSIRADNRQFAPTFQDLLSLPVAPSGEYDERLLLSQPEILTIIHGDEKCPRDIDKEVQKKFDDNKPPNLGLTVSNTQLIQIARGIMQNTFPSQTLYSLPDQESFDHKASLVGQILHKLCSVIIVYFYSHKQFGNTFPLELLKSLHHKINREDQVFWEKKYTTNFMDGVPFELQRFANLQNEDALEEWFPRISDMIDLQNYLEEFSARFPVDQTNRRMQIVNVWRHLLWNLKLTDQEIAEIKDFKTDFITGSIDYYGTQISIFEIIENVIDYLNSLDWQGIFDVHIEHPLRIGLDFPNYNKQNYSFQALNSGIFFQNISAYINLTPDLILQYGYGENLRIKIVDFKTYIKSRFSEDGRLPLGVTENPYIEPDIAQKLSIFVYVLGTALGIINKNLKTARGSELTLSCYNDIYFFVEEYIDLIVNKIEFEYLCLATGKHYPYKFTEDEVRELVRILQFIMETKLMIPQVNTELKRVQETKEA